MVEKLVSPPLSDVKLWNGNCAHVIEKKLKKNHTFLLFPVIKQFSALEGEVKLLYENCASINYAKNLYVQLPRTYYRNNVLQIAPFWCFHQPSKWVKSCNVLCAFSISDNAKLSTYNLEDLYNVMKIVPSCFINYEHFSSTSQ